jgi:hypothetical protein
MGARVEPEEVRDAGRRELAVEAQVLRAEAAVAAADVEGEEGRPPPEGPPQGPDVRVRACARVRRLRADVERRSAGRVRRVEVTAPGLDDRERLEVVEGEERRAVPAGREPDDRAGPPAADRPEAVVDDARQLLPDRGLPVAAGPPVEVLRVAVAVARGLRRDEDRRPADAVERAAEEVDAAVGPGRGRQPVEEVDDGVAQAAVREPGGR